MADLVVWLCLNRHEWIAAGYFPCILIIRNSAGCLELPVNSIQSVLVETPEPKMVGSL